jgi:hypothetical protein
MTIRARSAGAGSDHFRGAGNQDGFPAPTAQGGVRRDPSLSLRMTLSAQDDNSGKVSGCWLRSLPKCWQPGWISRTNGARRREARSFAFAQDDHGAHRMTKGAHVDNAGEVSGCWLQSRPGCRRPGWLSAGPGGPGSWPAPGCAAPLRGCESPCCSRRR